MNKGSDQAVWNCKVPIWMLHFKKWSSMEDLLLSKWYPPVQHTSVHKMVNFFTSLTKQLSSKYQFQKHNMLNFIKLCQEDDFERTLLYAEAPKYFTWNSSNSKFSREKQEALVEGNPGSMEITHWEEYYCPSKPARMLLSPPPSSSCSWTNFLRIRKLWVVMSWKPLVMLADKLDI